MKMTWSMAARGGATLVLASSVLLPVEPAQGRTWRDEFYASYGGSARPGAFRQTARPRVARSQRRLLAWVPFVGTVSQNINGKELVPVREFVQFLNEVYPDLRLHVHWQDGRITVSRGPYPGPPQVAIRSRCEAPDGSDPDPEPESAADEATSAFAFGMMALGQGRFETARERLDLAAKGGLPEASAVNEWLREDMPADAGVLRFRREPGLRSGQIEVDGNPLEEDMDFGVLRAGLHQVTFRTPDGRAFTTKVTIVAGRVLPLRLGP